jgi:DUF1009 family protein
MIAAGATALVIDAGKTIIFDKREMVLLADSRDIAVVALPPL